MNHPNLDFQSLQAVVDRVRHKGGQRDRLATAELNAISGARCRDPLRTRYPNFRWRLIPTVYCVFHAVLCLGGLVTYDVAGNASYAGHRHVTISLAHSVLFWFAAYCWFKNYWRCGILFLAAVIILNRLVY